MAKQSKVYDSIAQCSAAEGLSRDVLQKAKRAGSPNFRGSRVHMDGLRRWIGDHQKEINAQGSATSLKDQKTALECRKLKRIEDTADRLLVEKAEIAAAIRRILGQVSTISEAKLVNEYPAMVSGLDVAQARVFGRNLHDLLMQEYQKLAAEFPE